MSHSLNCLDYGSCGRIAAGTRTAYCNSSDLTVSRVTSSLPEHFQWHLEVGGDSQRAIPETLTFIIRVFSSPINNPKHTNSIVVARTTRIMSLHAGLPHVPLLVARIVQLLLVHIFFSGPGSRHSSRGERVQGFRV